jgi:nucleotide-binding universal stress UspA family protein
MRSGSVVVVGVDGSSAGDAALRHALHRAHDCGGSVELVTAWRPQSLTGEDETVYYRAGHRWAVRTQRAAIERAGSRTAQLPPLTGVVGDGDPAELLADVGANAACIVVASGRTIRRAPRAIRPASAVWR